MQAPDESGSRPDAVGRSSAGARSRAVALPRSPGSRSCRGPSSCVPACPRRGHSSCAPAGFRGCHSCSGSRGARRRLRSRDGGPAGRDSPGRSGDTSTCGRFVRAAKPRAPPPPSKPEDTFKIDDLLGFDELPPAV